jgi:hypothetical protein
MAAGMAATISAVALNVHALPLQAHSPPAVPPHDAASKAVVQLLAAAWYFMPMAIS